MCHAVLAVVSNCCPPLKGRFLTRYSPVRHCPLFQLDESSFHRFSFDLHVLSTPPAFVLSQDQTLYKWYLNSSRAAQIFTELFVIASKTFYTCLIYKVHAHAEHLLLYCKAKFVPRFSFPKTFCNFSFGTLMEDDI